MMHISCDGCGKDLTETRTEHFILKIEAFAQQSPAELTPDDLMTDHLDELSDALATAHASDLEPLPQYTELRYDLCPTCQRKFLADPLARETQKFDFSPN